MSENEAGTVPGVRRLDSDLRATRVVIADDDEEYRALLAEALRGDGYIVEEAGDGAELLEIVHDAMAGGGPAPDVVVTDVLMPRLSGLGALLELKRAHVGTAVVMMTGFSFASVEVLAKRLGAAIVLQKPFGADELRAAVRTARTGRI